MRFEARIKNVPEKRWGVWDHTAQEWRETMLGTTEEVDARQSAEVMNSMPASYALGVRMRIKRPPRTFLVRYSIAIAFAMCAVQLTTSGNWEPNGPGAPLMIVMVTPAWAWWKLFQVGQYNPDVHIVHIGMEPREEGAEEQEETQ